MRKILSILSIFVLLGAVSALGATYTEDFDTANNWGTDPPGNTITSYDYEKVYTNAAASPAGDEFRTLGTAGTPVDTGLREGSYVYGASGYAFRLASTGTTTFRYRLADLIVVDFSLYLARWDNSPKPDLTVRYSTDSGGTYTDLLVTNGDWFTVGDKAYQQYSSGSLNISPDTGEEIYLEVQRTTGERLLMDQFELNYIPEPALLGIAPLALIFFRRR